MDDIASFDRFARLYDLVMPSADAATLTPGLDLVDGPIEWVIDLGGGTGRAATVIDDAAVVVDAAAGMVRRARANGHEAVLGDVEQLPLGSNAVDVVLIVDALHHFPTVESTLRAVFRVIRPGGAVIIREFDPTTLRGRLLSIGEQGLGFDSRFYAPDELSAIVETAGFQSHVLDRGFGYTVCGTKPMTEAPPGETAGT